MQAKHEELARFCAYETKKFIIPPFQRAYDWDKNNVLKLIV